MRLILACLATAAVMAAATRVSAQPAKITVQSSAFKDGQPIPLKHSAYGDNLSPPLMWSGLPSGTRKLALILDDPDAPTPQPFVHWVIYDIPATAKGLPEGLATDARPQAPADLKGTIQGPNGARRTGYFGPRPPAGSGVHHYTFTLYALDADVKLAEGLTKQQLLDQVRGHVVGEGKLVGVYEQR